MILNEEFIEKYEELILENTEEAIDYCIKELNSTNNPDLYVYLGDAYMAKEDFERAAQLIEEGIRKNCENHIYGYSLLGEANFYLDNYEKSKEAFNEIIKEDPLNFFAGVYLIDIDIAEGNYKAACDRAINLLDSKVLEDEDKAFIETKIAWIKIKYLNELDEALIYINSAIARDENCGTAYVALGLYNLVTKNYQEAIKNYEKAIELEEDSEEVQEGIKEAKIGMEKNT